MLLFLLYIRCHHRKIWQVIQNGLKIGQAALNQILQSKAIIFIAVLNQVKFSHFTKSYAQKPNLQRQQQGFQLGGIQLQAPILSWASDSPSVQISDIGGMLKSCRNLETNNLVEIQFLNRRQCLEICLTLCKAITLCKGITLCKVHHSMNSCHKM